MRGLCADLVFGLGLGFGASGGDIFRTKEDQGIAVLPPMAGALQPVVVGAESGSPRRLRAAR